MQEKVKHDTYYVSTTAARICVSISSSREKRSSAAVACASHLQAMHVSATACQLAVDFDQTCHKVFLALFSTQHKLVVVLGPGSA
jgi:hypothetical protein